MTQQRIKPLYRAAFDFHAEALSKLGTITQADFWEWFFDKAAHNILGEHDDDRQTMQDFILLIHGDVERQESKIYNERNDSDEPDAI